MSFHRSIPIWYSPSWPVPWVCDLLLSSAVTHNWIMYARDLAGLCLGLVRRGVCGVILISFSAPPALLSFPPFWYSPLLWFSLIAFPSYEMFRLRRGRLKVFKPSSEYRRYGILLCDFVVLRHGVSFGFSSFLCFLKNLVRNFPSKFYTRGRGISLLTDSLGGIVWVDLGIPIIF